RNFRARRAARDLVDQRIDKLSESLQARCLTFAHRHLESASTYLRLLGLTPEGERRDRLIHYTGRAIDHALKSLSRVGTAEAKLAHRTAAGLRQRLMTMSGPDTAKTMAIGQSAA